ncbi:YczE/YyaS/YitT family protein [Bacillus sp. PS06]|uniref:YczE/YyaS/YitT family protein n=1 Tax=Bacillus sp. PS06 TaxID=2764176 RepID=UPI0017876A23|nr:membrane protein [Bacillus sp. PS06]MBD8069940.1 membrane protein [Bacillus sp. PS06]
MKHFLWRTIFFTIGLFIISLGVSLTIIANLGAGPWDALNVGLSNMIGLTVGNWTIIIGILLIFINAFLLKARPAYLAIVTITLIGFFIDFWLLIVFGDWTPITFGRQILILVSGIVTLALGIAFYLQAKFPLSPIDQLMVAISKRLKVNLMIAKTMGELTALVLAFIFKGPIGIGTIIITFSIGPLIQVFFPTFEKWMNVLNENHQFKKKNG